MWFGQFVHGVLEEAFRRYAQRLRDGMATPDQWSTDELTAIRELVKARLAAQGLHAWDNDLENLGDERADAAVTELGSSLFPLIHRPEVRLTGSRELPALPPHLSFRLAERYEMVGVVDVISHVTLHDPKLTTNPLVDLLREQLGVLPNEFEVIIDYKGMRRPPVRGAGSRPTLWEVYGWQLQTYAHLRALQDDHLPIVAGVIIYLNELVPTASDIAALRREVNAHATDVEPEVGSAAEIALAKWRDRQDQLPFPFRLQRAVRVVPVSEATITESLSRFDEVVSRIEVCRAQELQTGSIMASWEANASDEATCTACDSRTYCTTFAGASTPRVPS
jgi:hypothetical protein